MEKIGSAIVVDDFSDANLVQTGNRKIKKKVFPVGIFLILFFVESVIATGACLAYFVYAGRSRIDDIEKYTRNYSIVLSGAFAEVAELCRQEKSYSRLKDLFREKIKENTIDEAFFVLTDGKIIVHSNASIEKELNGNIANDEIAYNLDLIFKPAILKSPNAQFTEYNFIRTRLPFNRQLRMLIKKYLYERLDNTGWLVSRAVFSKGKPVGTVNFIISKKRIYRYLKTHIDDCIALFIFSLAGVFALSLIISIIVLIRYRGIQRKTAAIAGISLQPDLEPGMDEEQIKALPAQDESDETDIPEIIVMGENDDSERGEALTDFYSEETERAVPVHAEEEGLDDSSDAINLTRDIKDAIPVDKAE